VFALYINQVELCFCAVKAVIFMVFVLFFSQQWTHVLANILLNPFMLDKQWSASLMLT